MAHDSNSPHRIWQPLLMISKVAMGLGMAGIGAYETYTTPAVVLFGIAMAMIFVIPLGLINAVSGVQVTMNVLAELIGGAIAPGNALVSLCRHSMSYATNVIVWCPANMTIP